MSRKEIVFLVDDEYSTRTADRLGSCDGSPPPKSHDHCRMTKDEIFTSTIYSQRHFSTATQK